MAETFGELRAYIDDLAGLDLTPTERDRLLNEGHRKLCLSAEWTRVDADIGPTVEGQQDYLWPVTLDKILSLWLGSKQAKYSSWETVRNITNGELRFTQPYGDSLYFASFPAGVRSIGLFPIPGAPAGEAINIRGIQRPPLLADDADTLAVPPEFGQGVCDYASAIALGSAEDLDRDRAFFRASFDRAVDELRTLGIEGYSQGPAEIKVVGYDFLSN